MVSIIERIEAYCKLSGEDLFLSKRYPNYDSIVYSESYSTWVKASEWDWGISDPNDRQIMKNEIVIETDLNKETNFELTKLMQTKLIKEGISYWIYFTGNKSYHIHFLVNGLENIEDGKQRQKIKNKIAETLFPKEYNVIDKNNFFPKKLIRLEGAYNPKSKTFVELYHKQQFMDSETITQNLLLKAIAELEKEDLAKTKTEYDNLTNQVSNNKIYCMLMEDALKNKWSEGGRHINLCPNAVAILSHNELIQLAKTQNMQFSEFEGWVKKKPQFNCVQFRRYGATIGKKDICKECFKKSFNKNNW